VAVIKKTTQPFFEDETLPLGTEFQWSNGETGNAGTATLIDRFTHQDMPCRRIQHDITISGVADPFRYIIDSCQVADGSWKLL
jgi:surface antigen